MKRIKKWIILFFIAFSLLQSSGYLLVHHICQSCQIEDIHLFSANKCHNEHHDHHEKHGDNNAVKLLFHDEECCLHKIIYMKIENPFQFSTSNMLQYLTPSYIFIKKINNIHFHAIDEQPIKYFPGSKLSSGRKISLVHEVLLV